MAPVGLVMENAAWSRGPQGRATASWRRVCRGAGSMSVGKRLSALCGTVLVASGLVLAPWSAGPASAEEVIHDGGFEATTGNPPNSPDWTEADSVRGTPLCTSTVCSSVNGASVPHSGSAWARFGGQLSAYSHTASLSQVVLVPAGTAVLTYWY